MRLREERAQATVEIAVVTPVLLVLALIVYNVMIYASAVARFDRVVPTSCWRAPWRRAGRATKALSMPRRRSGLKF